MSAPIDRLLEVYREELVAYERVLELAREGANGMRLGRPLSELMTINQEKKRCLDAIAALERSIVIEKETWRTRGRFGDANAELDNLLATITRRIEEILDQERETDRWILHGAGLSQPNLATA